VTLFLFYGFSEIHHGLAYRKRVGKSNLSLQNVKAEPA